MTLAEVIPLLGFALAFVFGAVSQRTSFCTMGAFSDAVTFGDLGRLRMYVLAMAVAMLGAQGLQWVGAVDLQQSIYAGPRFLWLAHAVGGLLFGIGMTISSGCGARNLVRLGGGNLKSLLVLSVMSVTAYATLRGVLAPLRVQAIEAVYMTWPSSQALPDVLGWPTAGLAIGAALALPAIAWCVSARPFRMSADHLLGGTTVGLLVVVGWYVTGHLGFVPEDPDTLEALYVGTNTRRPESLTFVAPLAFALEWLTLWTDGSRHVTFGIAAMAGTLAGAAAHAKITGRFRWELFTSAGDVGRHVVGAVLMGFGGVTALGCSIGQGITGLSTLSLGAAVTLVFVAAGCILTLKFLAWRLDRDDALAETPIGPLRQR
jgi:uncharacterized protein